MRGARTATLSLQLLRERRTNSAYNKSGTIINSAFSREKAALLKLLQQSGPRSVPFTILPRLVRFRNINDPTLPILSSTYDLVAVSPYDLAASFGPGVQLKRVTLQLTDDPITPPPTVWPRWLMEKGQMAGVLKGITMTEVTSATVMDA